MNDRMHIETFLAEFDTDIAGLDELVETNAKAAGRIRSGAVRCGATIWIGRRSATRSISTTPSNPNPA